MAGLLALAVAAPVSAQRRFDDLSSPLPRHLADATAKIVAADVDGDGDLDLVKAVRRCAASGQNRLFRNDGDLVFVEATVGSLPLVEDDSNTVLAVDFDNDGDVDLLFGNDGPDRLYRNDGAGTFTDASLLLPASVAGNTRAVAAGDLDGDGDLDLVLAIDGGDRVLIQTPAGFVDETGTRLPATTAVTKDLLLLDADGDLDLDLVLGKTTQVRIFDNDGSGRFSDASTQRLPPGSVLIEDLETADFDNDGDLDVLAVGATQDRIYWNGGNGTFSLAAENLPTVNGCRGLAIGDFDGDGDLDIAVACFYEPDNRPYSRGGPNRLWFNDGAGRFLDQRARLPFDNEESNCALAADLDGDGRSDLLFGNGSCEHGQEDLLYRNVGGSFEHATPPVLPPQAVGSGAFLVTDLDGDGDPDVVAQNGGLLGLADGVSLWFQIDGRFVHGNAGRLPTGLLGRVDVGDVDGDGDPDLVFAGIESESNLFLNDGTGTFVVAPSPIQGRVLADARLGDLDGDGDVDLVTQGYDHEIVLWRSGGPALSQATSTQLSGFLYAPLLLADVDADGDPDLVSRTGVLHNDGNGNFGPQGPGFPSMFQQRIRSLDVGDIDGDGDLDVLFGSDSRASSTGQDGGFHLFRNDGAAGFTNLTGVQTPSYDEPCYAVRFGDVDGDGDLDIVMGNGIRHLGGTSRRMFANRLLVNDGNGTFTAVADGLPLDADLTMALTFVDHDEDGDLDLLLGSVRGWRLYSNLTRHLDAPIPVRPGGRYRLECRRVAGSTTGALGLVYAAPTRRRVVVPPLGVLGIPLLQAVHVATIVVPAPSGLGRFDLAVPNNPTLVGFELDAQAILVAPGEPTRFTNVTTRIVAP